MSNCCRLEVDVTKEEYQVLIGHKSDSVSVRSAEFVKSNPQYKGKEMYLDEMYGDLFGKLKKDASGYCVFMDRSTRLCTVYDVRPKVCRDYEFKSQSCKSISKCIG